MTVRKKKNVFFQNAQTKQLANISDHSSGTFFFTSEILLSSKSKKPSMETSEYLFHVIIIIFSLQLSPYYAIESRLEPDWKLYSW